jgi:hypothetical protein
MISKKLINQMNDYYGCEYIVTKKPKKQKLDKLIKKINKENSPPDGWSAADAVKEDKPEPGKVYALTGGPGARCIANGHSWKDSVVEDDQ